MEANRYSPDNVLLHDPSSRRRNKLHLTSPSGLAVVSEVVAVFGAVVPVGVVHRGQIAISVPVSAALGCLQLAPVHPAALLLTAATVYVCYLRCRSRPLYGRNYPPELILQLVLI